MLKKKKVLSLVLALALIVGTVAPCLAASEESTGKASLPSGESPYTSSSVNAWTNKNYVKDAWVLDWANTNIKAAIIVGSATSQGFLLGFQVCSAVCVIILL